MKNQTRQRISERVSQIGARDYKAWSIEDLNAQFEKLPPRIISDPRNLNLVRGFRRNRAYVKYSSDQLNRQNELMVKYINEVVARYQDLYLEVVSALREREGEHAALLAQLADLGADLKAIQSESLGQALLAQFYAQEASKALATAALRCMTLERKDDFSRSPGRPNWWLCWEYVRKEAWRLHLSDPRVTPEKVYHPARQRFCHDHPDDGFLALSQVKRNFTKIVRCHFGWESLRGRPPAHQETPHAGKQLCGAVNPTADSPASEKKPERNASPRLATAKKLPSRPDSAGD